MLNSKQTCALSLVVLVTSVSATACGDDEVDGQPDGSVSGDGDSGGDGDGDGDGDAAVDEAQLGEFPALDDVQVLDPVGGAPGEDYMLLGADTLIDTSVSDSPAFPRIGADGQIRLTGRDPARITTFDGESLERTGQLAVCAPAFSNSSWLQIGPDGSTYFAERFDTERLNTDGVTIEEYVLGRISPEGDVFWAKEPEGAPLDFTIVPVDLVLSDDALFLFGSSTEQLPDQSQEPGDRALSEFVARYDLDGGFEWVRQVPDQATFEAITHDTPVVDADGNGFFVSDGYWHKVSADGELEWRGQADFTFASFHAPSNSLYLIRGGDSLVRYDIDANAFAWERPLQTEPASGELADEPDMFWVGRFAEGVAVKALDDSLVLYGEYAIGHVGDVSQIPATSSSYTTSFVARVSLEGELVWFEQFAYDNGALPPATSEPQASHETRDHRSTTLLEVDQNAAGDLVVFGRRDRGMHMFALDYDDGALLPIHDHEPQTTDELESLPVCPSTTAP